MVNTRASKTNTLRKGAPPLGSTIRFYRRPGREGGSYRGTAKSVKINGKPDGLLQESLKVHSSIHAGNQNVLKSPIFMTGSFIFTTRAARICRLISKRRKKCIGMRLNLCQPILGLDRGNGGFKIVATPHSLFPTP